MGAILGVEARWASWTATRRMIILGWLVFAALYWVWRAMWIAGWQFYSPEPGDEVIAAVERVGGYAVLVTPLLGTALLRGSRRWLIAAVTVAATGAWHVVQTLQEPVLDDPAVVDSVRVDPPPPWLELPYSAVVFWVSLLVVAGIWAIGRRRRRLGALGAERIEA